MLNLDGEAWRWVRRLQSPAFAPLRSRALFYLVSEGVERLRKRVAALDPVRVDARDLMARYTIEFISAYSLGIDAASINKEDNVLYRMASQISRHRFIDYLAAVFSEMFPEIWKFEYLNRIQKDIRAITNSIQKARGYKPSGRNDFMDFLLYIRHQQSLGKRESDMFLLDDELIAAQVFLFFVGDSKHPPPLPATLCIYWHSTLTLKSVLEPKSFPHWDVTMES